MKKHLAWMLVFVICIGFIALTGCNKNDNNGDESGNQNSDTSAETSYEAPGTTGDALNEDAQYQLQMPERGDEIAVVNTTLGTIKIRLFPDQAALAVEKFKSSVEAGYYDGIGFENIQKDQWVQMDVDRANSQDDIDYEKNTLYHFKGAVSMSGDGISTSVTRILFVQAPSLSEDDQAVIDRNDFGYNEQAITQYKESGGVPFLDGQQTVFGQIFQGMDVLDEIANLPVNDDMEPESGSEVIINSVKIEKY